MSDFLKRISIIFAGLALMIVVALALSGCTYHYIKPGATAEESARATAWCEMHMPPIGQPFLDNCMRSQGWVRAP